MRDVTAVFVGPVGKPERCNWHRSNGYDACDVCGAKERFKKLLLAPLGRVGTVMQKEPDVCRYSARSPVREIFDF